MINRQRVVLVAVGVLLYGTAIVFSTLAGAALMVYAPDAVIPLVSLAPLALLIKVAEYAPPKGEGGLPYFVGLSAIGISAVSALDAYPDLPESGHVITAISAIAITLLQIALSSEDE